MKEIFFGKTLGQSMGRILGHESRRVQVVHSEAGLAATPATQGNAEWGPGRESDDEKARVETQSFGTEARLIASR